MVKGFKITTEDFLTITQVKRAMAQLPAAMQFKVLLSSNGRLEIDVTPKSEKVKLAMYKDKLSSSVRTNYLNTFTPFLRGYVKDMRKLEVVVYD